jgi:hypothetical protein
VFALRALGTLAGGSGVYACYSCVISIIHQGQSWAGWIVFTSSLLIAIWCFVSSYRAWRPGQMPPVASVSAITALFILTSALRLIDGPRPDTSGATSLSGFLLVSGAELSCLAIYISLAWWLAVALAVRERTPRIPPLAVPLACLSVWLATSGLLDRVTPQIANGEEPSLARSLLHVGLPIVAAVLVYRLLVRIEPIPARPKFGTARPDTP